MEGLWQIIADRLVISYDDPPDDPVAQLYRKELFDHFLPVAGVSQQERRLNPSSLPVGLLSQLLLHHPQHVPLPHMGPSPSPAAEVCSQSLDKMGCFAELDRDTVGCAWSSGAASDSLFGQTGSCAGSCGVWELRPAPSWHCLTPLTHGTSSTKDAAAQGAVAPDPAPGLRPDEHGEAPENFDWKKFYQEKRQKAVLSICAIGGDEGGSCASPAADVFVFALWKQPVAEKTRGQSGPWRRAQLRSM